MKKSKFLNLENLTFIGAVLGFACGVWLPHIATNVSVLGDLFLLLLKMMIVPLIFVSVFLAVAKQAGQGELGSIGSKTLAYFIGTSSLACITGLLASSLLPAASSIPSGFTNYDPSKLDSISFSQVLLSFFPSNPFQALANGEIIKIVFFSLLLGLACIKIEAIKRNTLIAVADAAHDLVMIIIRWILVLAPVGIFALVAAVVAQTDLKSFLDLGWFFAAVTVAACVHSLITLPVIGAVFGRFNPYRFIFNVREALLVALATASSSATLPVSTRVLEKNENVSPKTTGFVLPLGATLNMDGSALYQSLVVMYLGRVAGVDFTFSQQLLVFLFVMMSSSGTAGIPGGGIVMMGAILTMVGIPLELIGIYLLVDRFWDPIITMINVQGDLFATKTIDRFMRRT